MSSKTKDLLTKMEMTRLEASQRMAHSSKVRTTVRKQIYLIFIDFILIVATLLVIGFISIFREFVVGTFYLGESIGSVVLLIIALIVIVPAIIHLVRRISVIAVTLSMPSTMEGPHSLAARV